MASLWAGLVDTFLFYPVALLTENLAKHSSTILFAGILDQIEMWGFVAYSVLMHGIRGQTIGKILFKVKVYDILEKPLSMKQAVLRDIVPIISNALFSIYVFFNFEVYFKFFISDEVQDPALMPKWILVLGSIQFIWFILEVITMLSNKKRRALHDYIAGSVVCRLSKKTIQPIANSGG